MEEEVVRQETGETTCADQSQTQSQTSSDDGELNPMLMCMSQMMQQQQMNLANILALFLTHDEKNISQILSEVKQSVDNNSRCLLKLNETVQNAAKKS